MLLDYKGQQVVLAKPTVYEHNEKTVGGLNHKWVLLAICLLAFAIHAPLFFGEFTNFDDGLQITTNKDVTKPTLDRVASLFFLNYDRKNSNPMYMSFMLNWMLTPKSYVGFLVFNLAWLMLTIVAFFKFSQAFLRDRHWQLLATTLFAVHSVKADIVGWMSARCHFMAMPFFLMAFYAWHRYRNGFRVSTRVNWFFGAIFCFAMAVLNKNLFVVVLPLLVVYDLYTRRRLSLSFFLDKIPVAAVTLSIFFIRGRVSFPIDRAKNETFFDRLPQIMPTNFNLLNQYLYQLFVPGQTALDVEVFSVESMFQSSEDSSLIFMRLLPITSLAILFALFMGTVYLWRRQRQRLPFWFLAWTVIALLPVLRFIPFWTDFAFRYCWIPVTLFCVMIVAVFSSRWNTLSHYGKIIAAALFSLYLSWHGARTIIQCSYFDSIEKYWTNCLEKFPDSRMCSYKLGQYYLGKRKYIETIEALSFEDRTKSQRKWSRGFLSGGMISTSYNKLGDFEMASFYHERSLLRSSHSKRKSKETKGKKASRKFIKKHPVTQQTIDRFIESRKVSR